MTILDGTDRDTEAVSGYGPQRHAQPFPYWDRRRLIGEWTVEESVERIVHYRWAQQHLSAPLGAWVATNHAPDVQSMLGPHRHQHAGPATPWRPRPPHPQA